MSHSNVRKFTLAGLIALPLLAVVAVAIAFAWGQSSSEPVSAANPASMELTVKAGSKPCTPPVTNKVCVTAGQTFTLGVDVIKAPSPGGYSLFQTFITYGAALVYKKGTIAEENVGEPAFPDANTLRLNPGALNVTHAGANSILPPFVAQFYTGNLIEIKLNCPAAPASSHTVSLDALDGAGDPASFFVDPDGATIYPASDTIQINCVVQPTFTPTQTATNTNTPTPTFTPVAQPPFVKSPSLQNLWLTRQGVKIPPVQCVGPQGGDDEASVSVDLGVPVAATDPKGSGKVVNVGAFEFEVNYDDNKVCVTIEPGQASITMTCFIEDAATKPTLEGVARIGCVTVGKKVNVDGIWNFHLSALGGALAADCVIGIQEAPLGATASGIFPLKGAMLATGPGALSGANCTGSTPAFGWVVPGAGPLAGKCQVTGPLAPCLFDNETGDLVALIPCAPPNLGPLCQANGAVTGNFFQEATTNEMAFSGTFIINGGTAFGKLVIAGTITGARKSRFALNLATVTVHPQPEAYSTGNATQDNGNVVQLLNKKCEIADDQGHPIPIFSCEDADVTIRWLEGDVEPDCSVDTLDTQAIAFRWGSEKGSLIYNGRFNLEPWGTQADNDIDIKDLQFVYGRFGSTCDAPHPDQPPVNGKA